MNFYASKVESSYLCAKEDRLTAVCENRYISNIDTQSRSSGHHDNPNIIKDTVVIKTKGSQTHGGNREGPHGDASSYTC